MADRRFVAKNGLDNNTQTITNVADPVNAQDAATRAFASNASNLSSGTLPDARVADATVTGKALTGYTVGANTALAAADTLLAAFGKLQGQVNARLTGNQSITLSGDATGSGATAITVTLANSGVTAGTYTKVTVDAKGRVTSGATLASGDLPTYTGTLTSSQVTTALGYTPPQPTGTGASGTWGISVSGNAATATTLQTARNINGVSFNGSANVLVPSDWMHSTRDFPNGTLIQTTIPYNVTNGDPWVLEIRGNSYGSIVPFDIQYQGYIYTDTIINHGGYSVGTSLSGLVVFNHNNNLCFWFPNQVYWHGYYVRVYVPHATYPTNRVTSITNEAKPAGVTKELALSANIRQVLRSDNYTSYSPSLTGTGASGTWAISVSGSAATLTTARTINGTSFNGSANITTASWGTARTLSFTGDVTGSSSVDGSANVATAMTLANSGVTAGTYRSVTVDAKGRVTAGTNPTTLSGYGITDALSNSTSSTQSGYFGDIFLYDDSTPSHYLGITNSANLTAARTLSLNVNDADRTISLSGNLTVSAAATVSGTNTGDQTITLTGDVTGSGTGSFATTLANSGVTAGTYTKVTVDVKGRVTAGTTLASADLPTYTGTLTSGQVTTALGYTPIASSGSITGSSRYVAFLDTRAVDDQPQGKQGYSLSADFKNNTAVSSPPVTSTGTYSHILTIAGWDTAGGSGGWPSQLSVADGIAVRQATSATVWGPWRTVLHSNNYNTYAPTLTGTGASGTWGISITGNAATVTNGVVTTGSYANPAWITSLDAAKLTGTVAMARLTTTGSGQALMLSSGRLANAANLNDYRESGVWGTDATVTTGPAANSYDTLLVLRNSDVGAQIHVPRDPTARRISVRGWSNSGSTWTNWVQLVDTAGSGATGTWGISISGSSASTTGNAATATTLQTARTINGTSFNGSANITTASWGTSRTLTIGATGKAVDGSGNVSWTLAEIGALPLAGGTLTGALSGTSGAFSGNVTWGSGNPTNAGNPRSLAIGFSGGNYGAAGYGVTFTSTSNVWNYAINDMVSLWEAHDGIVVRAAAGGTVGTAITFTTVLDARRSNTSMSFKGNVVLDASNYTTYTTTKTGTGASGTWGISVTGSAATLTTARTLTIGATGKTFDGSGNVSWTLAELGALALTGGTLTGALEIAVATGNNTKLAYIRGTTGTGLRLGTEGTVSVVEGVDGTNGVTSFQPLALGGSTVTLRTGGTARLQTKANGQTRFVPLAADPAGQEAGDVYYNSTTNKLRYHDGSAWSDVTASAGMPPALKINYATAFGGF